MASNILKFGVFYNFQQFTLGASRLFQGTLSKFCRYQYPFEYKQPKVKNFHQTNFASSLSQLKSLGQGASSVKAILDLKKSKGNYFVDIDGNIILDMNGPVKNIPLGYNHDKMIDALDSPLYDPYILNPVAFGYPNEDFADLIRGKIMPIAPPFLTEVVFCDGTGSIANENAIKAAYLQKFKEKDFVSMTSEEITEFFQKYPIMTFEGSSHGIITSNGQQEGLPHFPYKIAPFPKLKFPYGNHKDINAEEEDVCLDQVVQMIKAQKAQGGEFVAMIVEPIQHKTTIAAQPMFYKKLRRIAQENNITFIVDECHTGCGATEKMWSHELWHLEEGEEPDIVTFGGKAQASGYFTKIDYRPDEAWKIYDSTMCSTHKILQFQIITNTILKKNLLERVGDTGSYIHAMLIEFSRKNRIRNVRGHGTYLAFDLSHEMAKEMSTFLFKYHGIYLEPTNSHSFNIRPSLILDPLSTSFFIEGLRDLNDDNFQQLINIDL